jgi:hypothetical protein
MFRAMLPIRWLTTNYRVFTNLGKIGTQIARMDTYVKESVKSVSNAHSRVTSL